MIRSLAMLPERFALVDWEPWASMKMRKVPVGNFVIFFLINEEAASVSIVRIFYGGRDIQHIAQDAESGEK